MVIKREEKKSKETDRSVIVLHAVAKEVTLYWSLYIVPVPAVVQPGGQLPCSPSAPGLALSSVDKPPLGV